MRKISGNYWVFYLQTVGLLLLCSAGFFILDGSYSFSAIYQQEFSKSIHFILVNYSFLGDCIFVFVFAALLILLQKEKAGAQLFFACLLTFLIEQVTENIASAEAFTLHFERLQRIYQNDLQHTQNIVSLNTAMMITCCATFKKYRSKPLLDLFLLIAVLMMAFSRIYLVHENLGSILLAVSVSFIAFSITELRIKYKKEKPSFERRLLMNRF